MNHFTGTSIWDLGRAAGAWTEIGAQPGRGLVLNGGPRRYAIDWEDGQPPADAQVRRSDSAVVVVCGAVRMRPDAPDCADVAGYIAAELAGGRQLESILAELDGEFLLIAWDADSGTLMLANDPTGHRTAYYALAPGGAIWSSNPWRVARALGTPKVDREALNLYFALKGVPAPWTLLAGVRKLQPGHVLRLSSAGASEREYWRLAERAAERYTGSLGDASADLLDLLGAAIRRYVEDAPRPVGLFLSGGLDSAALLAVARREGLPLHAFSVGYTPAYHGDETAHARHAAAMLGAPIEVWHFSPRDAAELAHEVLPGLPEPAADPTLLPQLFLARQLGGQVSVVLDGTGSDVIFAGTTKYVAEQYARVYRRLPAWARHGLIEPASRALPSSRRWRLTNLARKWQFFLSGSDLSPSEREVMWTCFASRATVARVLPREWLTPDDVGAAYLRRHRQRLGTDDTTATCFMTLKGHTPWVDLLKLACLEREGGISIRTPFLSPGVVEFGLRLPNDFKIREREGKVVLRAACDGIVPPGTLQRRKAIFATPISQWLGGDLRAAFLETMATPTGLFDTAAVRRMIRENELGWRDWQSELWAMFVLQRWWVANAAN